MDAVKSFLRNKIILAVLSIVLGVVLIILRGGFIDALVKVIGIVMIVVAVVFLLLFIFSGEGRSPLQIVYTVVSLIVGVFFLVKPYVVVNFFPVVFGIILAVSGAANLVEAIRSSASGGSKIAAIAVSAVVLLIGVLIAVNYRASVDIYVALIGVAFLVNGILEILAIATAKPAVVDMKE